MSSKKISSSDAPAGVSSEMTSWCSAIDAPDVLAASSLTRISAPSPLTVAPSAREQLVQAGHVRPADPHPAAAAGHDLRQRRLRDRAAAVDDHDVVGGLRDLGQHVAGDEDRAAFGGERAQEVAQPADALRVEAVRRLVEHEHARVAEQRGREPEPLAHAERVAAGAPLGRVL